MRLGRSAYRLRWLIVAGWLAAAGGLAVVAPRLDPAAHEPPDFLPDWADHSRAVAALRQAFPDFAGLSEAVVVFERSDGRLTEADLAAIESVAAAIPRLGPNHGKPDRAAARPESNQIGPTTADDLAGIRIRSPAAIRLPTNPLRSPDGKAALVVVSMPANFVTVRSARVVQHIRAAAADAKLPVGLTACITGPSGFGYDYAQAAERSSGRTLYVTLAAVLLILLLIYRSPVAALVPLAAISLADLVAMKVLAVAQHWGLHVGIGERIFVVALIYGAGTDYSLLLISRCREFIDAGSSPAQAAGEGLDATFSAIVASSGTDIAGLLTLCLAEYRMFRTAGAAIGVALVTALVAALTLVPALLGLLGRWAFWPAGRMGQIGRRRLWPGVARLITARPGLVLVVTLVLLALPAAQNLRLTWVYDALAELRPVLPGAGRPGNSAAGVEAARRHWPIGEIAPITILVRMDGPQTAEQWESAARRIAEAVAAVPGVSDIRSLAQPLGRRADLLSQAALLAAKARTRQEYISSDGRAMRLTVILDQPALALSALDAVGRIRRSAELAAGPAVAGAAPTSASSDLGEPGRAVGPQAGLRPQIHLAGITAEVLDVRKVTSGDFRRIAAMVLGVIFVMVLVLLRDAVLSAFIVAATAISYLAALGLSYWAFTAVGAQGLDWKVEIFLFVVMVAVGVDYSIFLAARLGQEAAALARAGAGEAAGDADRRALAALAIQRAVIHTGPVISSAGVIMAATLGSLMVSELKLLVQLGFALALGMLIDTFIIRPLLLPAFAALTGRTGRAAGRR